MLRQQCVCGNCHQGNFEQLYALHKHGFFVLVRELPGRCREQEEWQYEEESRNVRKNRMVHFQYLDPLKCDQDHQAIAEDVVVQGAKKLGSEERGKATLAE